jgi:hypothetical protein
MSKQVEVLAEMVHGYVTDEYKERIAALESELAECEARIEDLDWRPITPESVPKIGDEVASKHFSFVEPSENLERLDFEYVEGQGFYWYRPINPPSHEPAALAERDKSE